MIFLHFIFLIPFSLAFAQEMDNIAAARSQQAAANQTTASKAPSEEKKSSENQNAKKSSPTSIPEKTLDVKFQETTQPIQGISSDIITLPEPIQEIETAIEEIESEEPAGINTVSLEDAQGNWLFKRIWWERAEDRYGKIRDLVNTIWESRTKFFIQRNELDRTVLDPFYIAIGMGQGELQVILNELEEFFHKEREKEGELDERDRALYEALEEEQESFRQLKLDVESIVQLDHAIDEALGMLMDQINRARQLEKQAWDNFKEIAHILNDIKARELYYLMDGAGRNIKNISNYLDKDFSNHFARLISEAKKHVTRVLEQIKSLKEKGVDFKRQTDRIAQREEQEKERIALEEQEEEETIAKKPRPKQGWVDWALSLPGKAWDFIVSLIKWPYNMIFGSKK